jgi:dihydroflavonol-4-reductase
VNETCPRDVTAMDRVNVDGTMSVIRAAAAAGVGRVVYTSSAAAIGEEAGMIGTEATVHSGTYVSPYARSKHRAEVAALEQAAASGVDLVVVNPASVQGPGRSGGSARILLYALRSRRPVLVHTMISLVDIEDCTAGHIAAASRGRTGQRYLLSGATVPVADAVDLAAATTGRVVAPRWIGAGTLRSVGKTAAWLMHMVRPHSGICPALIETLLHGHRFDGSRAERDLALRYTPIEDTFARTIQWFEEQGLIGGS